MQVNFTCYSIGNQGAGARNQEVGICSFQEHLAFEVLLVGPYSS